MRLIRKNTFETNSSSTHSITMCMESEFEKWKTGEMYWDRWNDELVSKEEVEKKMVEYKVEFINEHPDFDENDDDWQEQLQEYLDDDKMYYSYEEFNDYDYIEYETFVDDYTTPSGDKIVAFGYYGYDG